MATAASRLSSAWARVALAATVLALAAGGAGFVLTRDEGDDETEARREAVVAYIVQVNTAQQASILELERVSRTYRELRLSERATPAERRRVEEAESSLRQLRARLSELAAPPEAATLRRQLLDLVDVQIVLAEEVGGMVRYLPVQAAQNRRLSTATDRLRAALGEAETGSAQREAFTAFRVALLEAAEVLGQADAPDVLEPARKGEVERLQHLASLAGRLAAALGEGKAEDVDRLLAQFVQTSAAAGTTKAERDAVVAFNRRVKSIAQLRAALVEERSRLDIALR